MKGAGQGPVLYRQLRQGRVWADILVLSNATAHKFFHVVYTLDNGNVHLWADTG